MKTTLALALTVLALGTSAQAANFDDQQYADAADVIEDLYSSNKEFRSCMIRKTGTVMLSPKGFYVATLACALEVEKE